MTHISLQQQLEKLNTPEEILYYDKHSRIEGLCSELVFQEEIAHKVGRLISDYWVSLHDGKFGVTKFMPDPSHILTHEDYIIMDHFSSKGIPIRIVYFDPALQEFRKLQYKKGTYNIEYNFASTEHCPIRDASLIKEELRDPERLKLACSYLNKSVCLKQVAIRRLFANHVMPIKTWDLDGLHITDDGKILLFEIKHKYPAFDREINREYVGINAGQKGMLAHLVNHGIIPIHIILLKPKKSKSIPAVQLITNETKYPKKWFIALPDLEALRLSDVPAPEESSYSGEYKNEFFRIYWDEFIQIDPRSPEINMQEEIYRILPK